MVGEPRPHLGPTEHWAASAAAAKVGSFPRFPPLTNCYPRGCAEHAEPHVERDQRRWRETREAMGRCRRRLAVAAEQLYPHIIIPGLERTGVIAHPSWIPSQPVPLASVALDLDERSDAPTMTGSERESCDVRPLASADRRYQRYSHALRDLASPLLFENHLCFRVTGVDWTPPGGRLWFSVIGVFRFDRHQ